MLANVKESITMITSTTQRGIKMNVNRKQELIVNWGFMPTLDGMYFRHAPMGYLEKWLASNPDVIQFVKDGEYSHDYKIDWNLFN
jgi:hypothetical protein